MEGAPSRKRPRSLPTRLPTLGSCPDVRSESAHPLAEGAAPEAALEAKVLEKTTKHATTKHAGGRPPRKARGLHVDNWHDHVAERKRKQRERALSADQVRNVVSVALDFPRIPVSSSATFAQAFVP